MQKTSIVERIGLPVSIQIALIICSFVVLAYYESQSTLIGNSINIAGKNRFLTSVVIHLAEKKATGQDLGTSNLQQAIHELDVNVDTLKAGGSIAGQEIRALPIEYMSAWQRVNQNRHVLEDLVSTLLQPSTTPPIITSTNSNNFITEIEVAGSNLVSASDNLVRNLSDGAKEKSENLIQLQIFLLVINVAVHCLMFYLIVRIVKPIVAIRKAADQIKAGNLNVVIEPARGRDEVSTLATSFTEMVDNLKKYDTMQTEFINLAAHELRTPVQPLVGVTDTLAVNIGEREKIEITKAELAMIIRSAERLRHLSTEIVEASRIEAGRLKLQKESLDLRQILSDAIHDWTVPHARDNQAEVVVSGPTEPIILEGDKAQLSEVISILIDNAMKFTKSGSITVTAERQNGQAVVSVKDTGTGIDPSIMPRLFTRFATNSESGSGLGLYIAKSIVEAHGGRIWAQNNEREPGATFTFTVPVA
jgi:signal transduction histidine kinase